MNFYDKVHEMIRTLKETPEYKEYVSAKTDVKNDADLNNKIIEFRKFQKEEQMKYIKGQSLDEDTKKKLSDMYATIVNTDKGLRYFQSEIKLDVMLADMQKIISDGIQDVVEY